MPSAHNISNPYTHTALTVANANAIPKSIPHNNKWYWFRVNVPDVSDAIGWLVAMIKQTVNATQKRCICDIPLLLPADICRLPEPEYKQMFLFLMWIWIILPERQHRPAAAAASATIVAYFTVYFIPRRKRIQLNGDICIEKCFQRKHKMAFMFAIICSSFFRSAFRVSFGKWEWDQRPLHIPRWFALNSDVCTTHIALLSSQQHTVWCIRHSRERRWRVIRRNSRLLIFVTSSVGTAAAATRMTSAQPSEVLINWLGDVTGRFSAYYHFTHFQLNNIICVYVCVCARCCVPVAIVDLLRYGVSDVMIHFTSEILFPFSFYWNHSFVRSFRFGFRLLHYCHCAVSMPINKNIHNGQYVRHEQRDNVKMCRVCLVSIYSNLLSDFAERSAYGVCVPAAVCCRRRHRWQNVNSQRQTAKWNHSQFAINLLYAIL